MININDGTIILDAAYSLKPQLSFQEFSHSKYYKHQNEKRVFSLDGSHKIGNRLFRVSLYFDEGLLQQIHLLVEDENIKTWEDEPERKRIHDKLLQLIGINDSAKFTWGNVSSVYDPKSAISSIIVTYN